MTRGLYITANDKFLDQAIALLNSIRLAAPDAPVVLIPYDDNYQQVAQVLGDRFGVTVYEDLDFIERLSVKLQETFGGEFFARPNQFRKQACWFGPFDRFLYVDTDIVVFENILDFTDALDDCDFICCDYQHAGGIANVFSPTVRDRGVFSDADLRDIFNGGLWGARKGAISEADLYDTFAECAAHPEYFDFSQKTSDQPIINYMVLKRIPRRRNLARDPQKGPGSWAGSQHFETRDGQLFDPRADRFLQYLHWAGIRIEPGCPYWDVWARYRYWGEPMPDFPDPPARPGQSLKQWAKRLVGRG